MAKKNMKLMALVMILLVLSLPLISAGSLSSYNDYEVKEKSERQPLFTPYNQSELDALQQLYNQTPPQNTPSEQCEDKSKKADEKLKFMDNEVMRVIQGILDILRAICSTMGAIDSLISTLGLLIGMQGDDSCCKWGWIDLSIQCEVMWEFFEGWESIYTGGFKNVCCWLTCGWCTGTCYGIDNVLSGDYWSSSQSEVAEGGKAYSYNLEGNFGETLGDGLGALSPYDNIYTAIACLCPQAVLTNLKKLKSIYQVYDCCVDQACKNGQSTESCEAMLDESTCMYWEGALFSSIAKIISRIIFSAVWKAVAETLSQMWWTKCLLAAFELIQTPKMLQGLLEQWKQAFKSFEEPTCSDLGFDQMGDDFSEVNDNLRNQVPREYEDFDMDGYYDDVQGASQTPPSLYTAQDKAFAQSLGIDTSNPRWPQAYEQTLYELQQSQQAPPADVQT
ncbi:MAG: hypothetical protein ABII01_06390 [Candidatus Woesearchaeota archaeon]